MDLPKRVRRVLLVSFLLTASALAVEDLLAATYPTIAGDFYTVIPCRVVDTRPTQPLISGMDRLVAFYGTCGVPSTARAVAIQVTTVGLTGNGDLILYPANFPNPTISTLQVTASRVRSNIAIVLLASNGTGLLRVTPVLTGGGGSGGTVHLVIDITGYFE